MWVMSVVRFGSAVNCSAWFVLVNVEFAERSAF